MTTVVHFIGSLDRGGAEMVALDLCRRIPSTEVRQVFVCLSGRNGALAGLFEAAGAIVEAHGFTSPLKAAQVVRDVVRRHRPDAVVSHVSLASGWMLAVSWAMGVRVRIARLHSQGDGRGTGLARRAYRVLARALTVCFASRIVAVSHASLRFGAGRWAPLLGDARAVVVGNGVDTERFRPGARLPAAKPRVIHVGRASPEKNRAALVPIFTALDAIESCGWWVVGPGGDADLGTIPSHDFEVLGDRSDVAELLREVDVLILPSLREGLPGVVLEALSTGVPVVASDLDTLRELAAKLVGIALVPLNAQADQWAGALTAAIAQKRAAGPRIRAAVLASEFTIERSVRDWRELFEGH